MTCALVNLWPGYKTLSRFDTSIHRPSTLRRSVFDPVRFIRFVVRVALKTSSADFDELLDGDESSFGSPLYNVHDRFLLMSQFICKRCTNLSSAIGISVTPNSGF